MNKSKNNLNGLGKKLVHFPYDIPLSKFSSCPKRKLPVVKGKIIEIVRKNYYLFKIGPGINDVINVVEGYYEKPRKIDDEEWLQYNNWSRADHHRFWSVKFQNMLDDKFFPINVI